MVKSFRKLVFREIFTSASRFFSILLIVSLGVGFFAGLGVTPIDMKYSADKYFDDQNLYDIRIISTLGLTDDDISEIENIDLCENVYGAYSSDCLAKINNNEQILKLYSTEKSINDPKIISGRLPQKSGEIAIDAGKLSKDFGDIGDKISVSRNENLKVLDYTIVGIIQSPIYMSFQRGNTTIGDGKINAFGYIYKEDFDYEAYTEAYISVKGAKKLMCYSKKYDDLIEDAVDDISKISAEREIIRFNDVKNKAQHELDSTFNKAQSEINSAQNKLDLMRAKYDKGYLEYQKSLNSYNNGLNEYQKNLKDFNLKQESAKAELEKSLNELNLASKKLENQKSTLDKNYKEYYKILSDVKELKEKAQNLSDQGKADEAAQVLAQAQNLEYQANIAKNDLDAKSNELQKATESLNHNKQLLDQKISLGNEKLGIFERELEKAKDNLSSAKIKLNEAKAALDTSLDKINSAQKKIDENNKKMLDEKQKAEKEINDIKKTEWYILNRDTNYSFLSFESDCDRVVAISKVFPLFFLLVALLVCLTTMTRMIDEQRVTIGTLKAIGYSKYQIALKYLVYSLSATFLGSVLGIAIGFFVFPKAIFSAYSILYNTPKLLFKFSFAYAGFSTLAACICTTVATLWACFNSLKSSPSSLMRAKAPKAGKKIFLEKIKFIWNKLNFTQKVTARNIIRYKKRFFMTVIGIAGCTALLLCGFGLKDSISGIVPKQFNQISVYDMSLNLSGDDFKGLSDEVKKNNGDIIFASLSSVTFEKGSNSLEGYMMVPSDFKSLNDYIKIKKRGQKEGLLNLENQVIISEKIANKLGVKIGDTITVTRGDNNRTNIKIDYITENYIYNYIYLSKDTYKENFDDELKTTTAYANFENKDNLNEISKTLLKQKGVNGIELTKNSLSSFKDIFKSLNSVVYVLIICACLLCFIVLYNLTNINITERTREIATLKVLGFYDGETSAYIFRENVILTIIGSLFGLILGIFLHAFVITTAEIDMVMFCREIGWLSYILSVVLTLVFAMFVNFMMHFRLKKIDMAQSLKSIE